MLLAGAACMLTLTACTTADTSRGPRYRDRPVVYGQTAIGFEDDYDYYPGYEVYYSRNRREYVYRDSGRWVRRPEPRGVSVDVLFAAPSVRMDFRDSPERHHDTVIRRYPRHWHRSDRDDRDRDRDRDRDDRRDDRR
jgi:hypothetical protein